MSNNKQTTIRIDPEWQAAIDTLKERFAIPKATTVLRMATFLTLNDGYRYMPDYEIRRAAGERGEGTG